MATFLKFIGPMASYTRGKVRFDKNQIYKILNDDFADDLLRTGRFRETDDPSQKKQPQRAAARQAAARESERRGGVRINRERAAKQDKAERGDMSVEDLKSGGGHADPEQVKKVNTPDDDRPRLPASQFEEGCDPVGGG
jgi:hypothetical protein